MIELRYAQSGDVSQIVHLLKELGYPSDDDAIGRRLSKIRKRSGEVIVAVNEREELLGCVHAFLDLRLAEGEVGEIVSLVIRSDSRGKGIGKKLVQEAQQWIAANGCTRIRVRANAIRTEAHRFYEQLGFNEIKSQKVFFSNSGRGE